MKIKAFYIRLTHLVNWCLVLNKIDIPITSVPTIHRTQPISKAITFFLENFDVVMVLDDKNRFEGMIRVHDVVGKGTNPSTLSKSIMNKSIPTLLQEDFIDTSALEIGEMMIDGATRYIPVLDSHLRPKGAVKDINLLSLLSEIVEYESFQAREAANWEITTLSLTDTIGNAIAKIREFGFSKIPILSDEGKIEGIINNRSLLRSFPERRATFGDLGGDRDKDWHLLPIIDFIQSIDCIPGDTLLSETVNAFISENTNFIILIHGLICRTKKIMAGRGVRNLIQANSCVSSFSAVSDTSVSP